MEQPEEVIVKRWQCPFCKFLITALEREQARYNYPCPRCKETCLSDFVEYESDTTLGHE